MNDKRIQFGFFKQNRGGFWFDVHSGDDFRNVLSFLGKVPENGKTYSVSNTEVHALRMDDYSFRIQVTLGTGKKISRGITAEQHEWIWREFHVEGAWSPHMRHLVKGNR